MTNTNDNVTKEIKLTATTQPTKTTHHSQQNNILNKSIIFLIFCLIIITTTATVFYINAKTDKNLQTFTKQIELLSKQQVNTQADLENISNNLSKDVNKKLKNITTTLNSALKDKWYQANDWILLKARYYLELAIINTKWTNDLATSSELLKEADLLLKTIPNASINEVRKIIADEQLALKQVNLTDYTKILSTLAAIQKSIANMELKTILEKNNEEAKEVILVPNSWQEQIKLTINKLSKLIIIRHTNDTLTPIITPAYIKMLKENIRLNLQEAQWALIAQEQGVFQIAIKQATENIKRGFNIDGLKTKAILDQLENLKKLHLAEEKPSLEESLEHLNLIISTKDNSIGTTE